MTDQGSPPSQRLRVLYRHGPELRYLGHLDLVRAMERALRRANLPVALSQGFNARPRITHAAPLPVGFTSEAEWVDILLRESMEPADFAARLACQLPTGLTVLAIADVPRRATALPARLREARYRVELLSRIEAEDIRQRIAVLLEATQLMRPRRGGGRGQAVYDLRPMLVALSVLQGEANPQIAMTLTAGAGATGRPEEVLDAMGLRSVPARIARLELIFHEDPTSDSPALGDQGSL
jgi:radical SAM-linked protein